MVRTQAEIKALIDQYITTNGEQEITGATLNAVLQAIADESGYTFDIQVYPQDAALEFTFYNPDTPDGEVLKINADVSNIGNSKLEAISAWWAAQKERRINVIGGYDIEIASLTTSPQNLGPFKLIESGQIIASFTNATELVFGVLGGGSVTINASDLPYKATQTLQNVSTASGTASNVKIHVNGADNGSVSVSQNTSTGHIEIHIGSNDYPVASVEDVEQIYPIITDKFNSLGVSFGKRITSSLTWEVAGDAYKYEGIYLSAGRYRLIIPGIYSGCPLFVKCSDSTYQTPTQIIIGNSVTGTDSIVNLDAGYYVVQWDTSTGTKVHILSLENIDITPTENSRNLVESGGVYSMNENQLKLLVSKDVDIYHLIKELYYPAFDSSLTYWIVINCAKKIGDRYYNSIYFNVVGSSTVVVYDKNFATQEEAINDFEGIKGGNNGYVLLNPQSVPNQQVSKTATINHPLTLEYSPNIFNHLQKYLLLNRTILWEGDSICADNEWNNTGWRTRVQDITGANGVNYSEGGSVITANLHYEGSESIVPSIFTRIATDIITSPNVDYFIFDGGTNDADRIGRIVEWTDNTHTAVQIVSNKPSAFGNWNETDFGGTYDTDTFCGAFEQIIYNLLTTFKDKKIGYIIAPKMGSMTSLTFYNRKAYFDTAKAICKKWGVPVLDLWENTWMNPNLPSQWDSTKTKAENVNANNYYLDGQHPAPVGYDYLSPIIAKWIETL